MGSGSSKSNDVSNANKGGKSPRKPVANVNKQAPDSVGLTQRVENNQYEDLDPANKSARDKQIVSQHYNATKLGASSPIKPIEPGKKDKDALKEEKDRKKKPNNEDPIQSTRSSVTALKFEDYSDFENDIDEVLKIPMAAESTRKSRDREKKKKKDKDVEHFQDENYNNYYNNTRSLSRDKDDTLPETYAQRLQRQQYKLQQDMLVREKTIVRNPQEWHVDGDEEEMEVDSPRKGFDASKFRAANKGEEIKTKKELFTTSVTDDFKTPRYLQTTGQDVDDVDVQNKRQISPQRQLPFYNQSEIDLMQQLEQDLL